MSIAALLLLAAMPSGPFQGNPETLATIRSIGFVDAIAISPDGKSIAASTSQQIENRSVFLILVFSAAEGRVIHTYAGAAAPVYALAFSQDGTRLAGECVRSTPALFVASLNDEDSIRWIPGTQTLS